MTTFPIESAQKLATGASVTAIEQRKKNCGTPTILTQSDNNQCVYPPFPRKGDKSRNVFTRHPFLSQSDSCQQIQGTLVQPKHKCCVVADAPRQTDGRRGGRSASASPTSSGRRGRSWAWEAASPVCLVVCLFVCGLCAALCGALRL